MAGRAGAATRSRRYDSSRRAAQAARTRTQVIDAAGRLFAEHGWSGTGMRDVARAAGVAVETVYSNFGSKPELLLAALDAAVVGDVQPIALADRPEFAELAEGPLQQRAATAGKLVRRICERTLGLGMALREAAASDPEVAARLAESEEQRRTSVAQAGGLVAGRRLTDTERDGLWALVSLEVYRLLVEQSAWSARRYERWIAEALVRLLDQGNEEQP